MMNTKRIKEITRSICDLVGISQEAHFNMQVDSGMRYIKLITRNKSDYELYRDHPFFWAWWRMNWARRDELLLRRSHTHPDGMRVTQMNGHIMFLYGHEVVDFYEKHNAAESLEYYPNAELLSSISEARRKSHVKQKSIVK